MHGVPNGLRSRAALSSCVIVVDLELYCYNLSVFCAVNSGCHMMELRWCFRCRCSIKNDCLLHLPLEQTTQMTQNMRVTQSIPLMMMMQTTLTMSSQLRLYKLIKWHFSTAAPIADYQMAKLRGVAIRGRSLNEIHENKVWAGRSGCWVLGVGHRQAALPLCCHKPKQIKDSC